MAYSDNKGRKMRSTFLLPVQIAAVLLAAALPAPSHAAQNVLDRTDPAVLGKELKGEEPGEPPRLRPLIADQSTHAAESGVETLLVGAIRIDGTVALPPAAFAPVIETYAGRTLTPRDLSALASAVANVARTAGYGLATAWVPRQRVVNGILRVTLDEGRIDSVRVEGGAAPVVGRILAPLANGRPVRTAELERRLLLAGDIAGMSVGKARLERSEGRNILVVDAKRERAVGRVALDNWGISSVGPVRLQGSVDLHGVADRADRLTLGAVATVPDVEEFHLVRIGYAVPVGTNGTEVRVDSYVARSEPGGAIADRDYDGRSLEAALAVSHPFVRRRAWSLWGDLGFAVRDSRQSLEDVRIRDDRFATLTASAFANAKLGDGRIRGRVAFVQGVDAFDATERGDPLASRADGSAIFSKLEAWARVNAPLTERLSLQVEAQGQIASRPLLSSEEMGLGGRTFLRGYDYRELSGDKGVAGSAELRFDLGKLGKAVRWVQPYLYADAGSVGNYQSGAGGGSLASAGGGVRLWLGSRFEAGVELGVPLTDGAFGRDCGTRLSLTFGARL